MSEPSLISSPHNPAIRYVVRLRDNRFRQREGVVIVDGVREIERAIQAGLQLRSLFVAENSVAGEPLQNAAVRVTRTTDAILERIAFGQSHRDAVAVFDAPQRRLLDLRLSACPIVIVLDGIEKPGNVGAVFRTADAIGADAVVLCDGECDLFNPSAIRASLSTVFSVPAAQATREETIQWLADHQLAVLATRVDAVQTHWEADCRQPLAIVIGSEAHGLSPAWSPAVLGARLQVQEIRIPMAGIADSLNASIAAAVLMFEVRRQRSH